MISEIDRRRINMIKFICTNFENRKPRFKTHWVIQQEAEMISDFIIDITRCETLLEISQLCDRYCFHVKDSDLNNMTNYSKNDLNDMAEKITDRILNGISNSTYEILDSIFSDKEENERGES